MKDSTSECSLKSVLMESLATSIVRWTDTSFDDALKALEIARKNIPRTKFNKLEKNPSEDFQNG